MCGRFTALYSWDEIYKLLSLIGTPVALAKRYNVAPTQLAQVVREDQGKGLKMDLLRWGLIPFWAKESKIGASLINARSETVSSKPAFRAAYKSRRCIVPISGFYEWKKIGEKEKQPYYISGKNDAVLLLAGLFEIWKSENETIESFSIITREANSFMKEFHDRMPLILSLEQSLEWADSKTDLKRVEELCKSEVAEILSAHKVSKLVNSPRNDKAECIVQI